MYRSLFILLVVSLQTACQHVFLQPQQEVYVPDAFQAAEETQSLPVQQPWLDDFDDVLLKKIINQAMNDNLDLKRLSSLAESASARASIEGARLLPQADLNADAGRGRSAVRTTNRLSAQVAVSWEADVWGRLQNSQQAAVLDYQSTVDDLEAAKLSLAARIARLWFQLIEIRQQWQLATSTAANFRNSLRIIEERYRRGLNSALDVRLARTDIATADNIISGWQRQYDTGLRQLDVLLGRYPAAAAELPDNLPQLIGTVPVGLPADLLIRRPDLQAAEQRLSAADERLQAAHKNRLPDIRLTGSGGVSSSALNQLLDWDSLIWNLLASLVQPVFDGGRLDAEQLLAESQHAEIWSEYAAAILTAFQEVESSLNAETDYNHQLAALTTASEEAAAAEALAVSQYQRGLIDIITLLESQRRAFTAESSRLRIERERLENRINLYLALGGDFEQSV